MLSGLQCRIAVCMIVPLVWLMVHGFLTESVATEPYSVKRLLAVYPEQLCDIKGNWLVWCDGTEMPIDDGVENKNFQQFLNQPDLEDQFRYVYPEGHDYQIPPEKNHDPGRIRYEPFMMKMYGKTEQAVWNNLVRMEWPFAPDKPSFMITRVNGVDKKMAAVIDELMQLPAEVKQCLGHFSGTYNWRKIQGTNRYSMHSFGMAIDLGGPLADYWRWDAPDNSPELIYRNRIPLEVVLVFERHGFVWGGKWYHYDTMHFEYRPELMQ